MMSVVPEFCKLHVHQVLHDVFTFLGFALPLLVLLVAGHLVTKFQLRLKDGSLVALPCVRLGSTRHAAGMLQIFYFLPSPVFLSSSSSPRSRHVLPICKQLRKQNPIPRPHYPDASTTIHLIGRGPLSGSAIT